MCREELRTAVYGFPLVNRKICNVVESVLLQLHIL